MVKAVSLIFKSLISLKLKKENFRNDWGFISPTNRRFLTMKVARSQALDHDIGRGDKVAAVFAKQPARSVFRPT